MNFDPASAKSSQILNTIKEISSSSRTIPSDKDFKLCYTSDEFKRPIDEIARKSNSMLQKIGAAKHIWGTEEADFPVGIDDAYEWLVDVNQEVFGRVDESIKELQKIMKFENDEMELENGKKKKMKKVRVETKDKEKVSFHISAIEKPQNRYNFLVNNANQPFQHVWLERSDDGQRFIHPLEKLSVLDFVDKDVEDLVPIEPPSLESTPFKLVEEVKGLKELAAKLHSVNEFAVDLEHNHYRSFQGLTCLMQISTRTEDFIVDTLKLRVHVGPYLRELFKDPTKKKVMHGADSDIVWLQRDFGIYVCNLFDTGQASRVLKLERFSLQYLLLHYCGVIANKEYQKADWRLRPLPDVMLRIAPTVVQCEQNGLVTRIADFYCYNKPVYGREDTHYLLYIYDLMRIKLLALSKESESSDNLLVEVYKRSYDVCMKLYEKELLTEDSYLHIYGLQGASFNGQQLAIVSGLYEWRDIVARAEDEGTGYVLPNKTILEIAKQMPVTTSHLRRLVNLYLPYIERNLDVILSIVRHSVQNAPAFEEAALRLKEAHTASVSNTLSSKDKAPGTLAKGSTGIENVTSVNISEKAPFSSDLKEESFQHQDKNGQITTKSNCPTSELPKDKGANVQLLKTPTGDGGVLLGNSASKTELDYVKKAKEEVKLEQIGSSINLPLHSGTISSSTPADVIMIDSDTDSEDMAQNNVGRDNEQRENEDEDDSSSFSDLSL